MKLKIEKIALPAESAKNGSSIEPFVKTACDLKAGESFLFNGITANHRNCLSVLQYAFGRKYSVRKVDDKSHRVFRVS